MEKIQVVWIVKHFSTSFLGDSDYGLGYFLEEDLAIECANDYLKKINRDVLRHEDVCVGQTFVLREDEIYEAVYLYPVELNKKQF